MNDRRLMAAFAIADRGFIDALSKNQYLPA